MSNTMVVPKRKLSPSSSFHRNYNDTSSMDVPQQQPPPPFKAAHDVSMDDSSHRDICPPLYSETNNNRHASDIYTERIGGGFYSSQPKPLPSRSPPGRSSSSSVDEDDADSDVSSTCSPSHHPHSRRGGGYPSRSTFYQNHNHITRISSASSVASEPYHLPHHHQHLWGSSGDDSVSSTTNATRKNRRTLVFTAKQRKHPLYIVLVVFCALGMYLYSQSHATLHDALQQVLHLTQEHRTQVHSQFRHVQDDIRTLQLEMMKLTSSLDQGPFSSSSGGSSSSSFGGGDEELNMLQEKLRHGSSQITTLQHHLQQTNKQDALQKYGAGPIRVQLELEFPNSHRNTGGSNPKTHLKSSHDEHPPPPPNNTPPSDTILILEMAPLDMMPHSVYMFLEMTSAGLFDGCSFILNAMHVIKAAPLPYDGSSASAKVRSFAKAGLESVAFAEYSPDFPHQAYTVGFAVDGSPSFYINTQDNSDVHIGEPCFAKIVSGFETIQRMEEAPTRNGIWYRQRIGIKRATILK